MHVHVFCIPQVAGVEEDTGRSNSGCFCSDRADGVSRVGLALVHSEA